MLLWNKGIINKTRIILEDIASLGLETELETINEEAKIKSSNAFAALVPEAVKPLQSGCEYPLDISNQFPLWTTYKTDETLPNLIDFTKAYFNWMTCGVKTDICPEFGFFELENIKKLEELPKDLLLMYSILYVPSLSSRALQEDVSVEELKTLLNGIYSKLYTKKGSEYSFKYLISLFFNVPSDKIKMIYPKKYLMVLNSGANNQLNGITPLSTVGRLNYSIIKDSTIWNEYSYVINVEKENEYIRRERFENLIRPLVHPIGLKDFYQEQEQLLSTIKEIFVTRQIELPKIVNYFYYNLDSSSSLNQCFGCTYPAPQNQPTYVFPSWSKDIPDGISFGLININDFWELEPRIEGNFPNNSITCTGCP